ncbi:hypothetical protein WJX73_000444 [Symbiochloris irregularis]|uniref:CCHC-type domain-containing protein n=1 Tax=Symbiochloris irregularis TaxID=706552 RepID=A0AAW1PUL9_9CHLO
MTIRLEVQGQESSCSPSQRGNVQQDLGPWETPLARLLGNTCEMLSSQPSRGAGCYKCGQKGHWSRDCTVPKEQWIPQSARDSTVGETGNPDPFSVPEGQDAGLAKPPKNSRRSGRKKPKLTVDLLKKQQGLPDVFHYFPDRFRKQYRGKGHEASDLQKLLEMYAGWQKRIFPHVSFDDFIDEMESLGKSYVLKVEMRDLRQNVTRLVEPAPSQEADADQRDPEDQAEPLQAGDADAMDLEMRGQGPEEWQDGADEGRRGMLADPAQAQAPQQNANRTMTEEEEDEELMRLAQLPDNHGNNDEIDDDELMAMAFGDL